MKKKNTLVCSLMIGLGLAFFQKGNAQNATDHVLQWEHVQPRMRVIIDNDFSGDPDGLWQLAHHLLSTSVEIRGIIGSHLRPGDGFDRSDQTATNAKNKVLELMKIMKLEGKYPVYEGSNIGLANDSVPQVSEAARAIVREAMREDTKLPLYVVCGAGLTDLASAFLLEPKIADRLTMIWIGGPEYPELATPPPGYTSLEYNLRIDLLAGQVIFNKSSIPIWQVPRNMYRQALMPYSSMVLKVKNKGPLGEYLVSSLERVMDMGVRYGFNIGETYVVGDSPLVLLTALQSSFEPDPSSSFYVLRPSPWITDQGIYQTNHKGRNIRVYTFLDNPLLLDDFYSKLELFHQINKSSSPQNP